MLVLLVLYCLLGNGLLNRVFIYFFNCFLWVWAGFLDICRLFSCGTSKDGESFIVEWNESEGAVKRTYHGFHRKRSLGVVQFDTTKNRFLAAGDDFSIKFWDMDNVQLLTTVEADGGLPVGSSSQNNNLEALHFISFFVKIIVAHFYLFCFLGKPTYPVQQGWHSLGCFCQ